jgi:hypothetical protein
LLRARRNASRFWRIAGEMFDSEAFFSISAALCIIWSICAWSTPGWPFMASACWRICCAICLPASCMGLVIR